MENNYVEPTSLYWYAQETLGYFFVTIRYLNPTKKASQLWKAFHWPPTLVKVTGHNTTL